MSHSFKHVRKQAATYWFLPFKIKCPSDKVLFRLTTHQHSYCVLVRSPELLAKLYSPLNDHDLECQFL